MGSEQNKLVNTANAVTESISIEGLHPQTEAYALRLDKIHPVVSGNKWFKLKYYLQEAKRLKHDTLLTWGGAYSNHIIATAFAAKHFGFTSIGVIRGERSTQLSHTLQAAESYGMQLHFVSRSAYAEKKSSVAVTSLVTDAHFYEIPEGGAGEMGIRGSREIAALVDYKKYSHILCAVGTGTMCSGLLESTTQEQQVIAIHVLKGMKDIASGFSGSRKTISPRLKELKEYHFGGYAKKNEALLSFMNRWYLQTGIPTDFVYTGKLFYAFDDLMKAGYFPQGSRILVIHSGGLQGNLSLAPGTLAF